MKRRLFTLIAAVALLALIIAACSTVQPQPAAKEVEASNPVPSQANPTFDEQLGEIARRVPGFGGLFLDDSGALSVYLVPSLQTQGLEAQRSSALSAIREVLGVEKLEELVQLQPQGQGAQDVRVLPGQYDVNQLLTWRTRLDSVLDLAGVSFTDFDEARNRLVIGYEGASTRAALERAVRDLGVPQEAVILEEAEPFEPLATLRSALRPIRGGLQIQVGSSAYCTLGFNVVRSGVKGFVTNSHCTNVKGGVESTPYYQSTSGSSGRVAVEAADPKFFTGGSCPSGQRCRYSDSAFARYTSGTHSLGSIARTTGTNNGSLTISGSFDITGEDSTAVSGEVLNKVGRTTGWTAGKVVGTCVQVRSTGTGTTLLCQTLVAAGVNSGDSGSPVFKRGNSNNVTLRGVLWGGGNGKFVFSSIGNIERELGRLTTSPSGGGSGSVIGTTANQGSYTGPYNLRSGPGTNYRDVGNIAGGVKVTIVCQATGTTHTGPWNRTNLWDKLSSGKWISDAYVYTGSNDRVAPRCN